MGCKESKHIATENTIITPSSSTKSTTNDANNENNVQTLQRSRSGRSTMQKQENLNKIDEEDSKANNVLFENEISGDDDKGTVDANRVLEKEGTKFIDIDDQVVKGHEEIIKEEENENVGENRGQESILIPKEDLPSTSRKDGESIEAIITDGVSGASVYYTPTKVAAAFDVNAKTEKADKKKPAEDTKTEEAAKENLTKIVDANPENHVQEAEVDEKIKEAEAAVATPGNHLREAEVEEKIKEAEAALASLENLVKEADKAEEILVAEAKATDAATQNPVKEAEEIPAKEVEATEATLRNPEKEADKSEEIRETEVEATDANLQNPVKQSDKSEGNRGTETEATDATLQNVGTESDRTGETLIKEAEEAVGNGVKEIHEVTGKAEEIPVNEFETAHESNQENQVLVADNAEVLEKEAEPGNATHEDLVKEAEDGHNAAITDEDTKTSSTANGRQISEEDIANKLMSK